MAKRLKQPKCTLIKEVNDRFVSCAHDYSKTIGTDCDAIKYIELGTYIQRHVYEVLRKVFMWEDNRFIDFDAVKFFSTNLLVQLDAKSMQKISHSYRRMLNHMRNNGLICISESYCHEKGLKHFCKSYTIHPTLLRQAIDTEHKIELEKTNIPSIEMENLWKLAKIAMETKSVEFDGLTLYFDIDRAMQDISDDFTSCQKDKYCLTPTKMRCALISWIDKTRNHEHKYVHFRDFNFLTSFSKAALQYVHDENGCVIHEIMDLPSGNILTTAISMYNGGDIPKLEFDDIMKGIIGNGTSVYDRFIADTNCKYSRKYIKKCFQVVINCSDTQLSIHEKKAARYITNPYNVHFKRSKCVVDIYNWIIKNFPKFGENLRTFESVESTSKSGKFVKGTYYAFTYIEKNLIDDIRGKLLKAKINTIRIHDAIWGFVNISKENVSKIMNATFEKFTKVERIFLGKKELKELFSSIGCSHISSNKVGNGVDSIHFNHPKLSFLRT